MFTENLFDQTLNLYKDSKSKSITLNCIRSFLANEEYQKSFIAHVNKLLNTSSTRLDGLQLATECIENISPNVLSEHGSFWVKCCLTNYENTQNKEIYLKALRSIIECSQKHTEFSRKLGLEFISSILDISLNSKTDLYIRRASLECLILCLKYYSSFCKQHKKKIEGYLLSFLESASEELVTDSGLAFFYSQKIPTIGNNTTSCLNNLTLSLRRLCVTCHHCLDAIFEHHLEIDRFDVKDIEPFTMSDPPLGDNSYLRLQYRTQIMKNGLEWLLIFLKEGTDIIEYPQEILNVLQRGLSLHMCSKQKSIESEYLYFNLMEIQTKILEVLSTLILSLKGRMAPFYPFVSEVLRNIFNKSKTCNCYKNFCVFQEYLYGTLLELLLIGHGLEKSLQNILVSQIIENNTPVEEGVSLKVHTNMKGKSSKTKQNMILNSITSKNTEVQLKSSKTKYQLKACISSLEGLLILMDDSSLDHDILGKIISFLIENIQLLQSGSIKAPFNNKHCQELLYEILCSVFEHDNSTVFETFGEVINSVFVNGCTNENLNISSICLKGLRNMEKVFHSLQYSTNIDGTPGSNSIRIIENNLLVPAAKIECHTEGEEFYEENVTISRNVEDEKFVIEEDIAISTNVEGKKFLTEEDITMTTDMEDKKFLIDQNFPQKEEVGEVEALSVEEDYVILTKDEIENSVAVKSSQEKIVNYNDKKIAMEPAIKKRKVEEDIEKLFVDEFDDDYK